MSKIDLISASSETSVLVGHPQFLRDHWGADIGSRQPDWLTTSRRPTARAVGVSGIAAGIAVVLTSALKICALFMPRLRCERRAMAPSAQRKADVLDEIYDATLDRLGNNRNGTTWWRRIVLMAQGDYVLPYGRAGSDHTGPHLLRIESVRQWISDYYVRGDLKALATEEIFGDVIDTSGIRARLAQSYAHYTLEDPILAKVRIDTVVSGLVAGVLSSLRPSERTIVSLMRESNSRINRSNAEVLAALSRIEGKMARSFIASRPAETQLHSELSAGIPLQPKVPASIAIELTGAAA